MKRAAALLAIGLAACAPVTAPDPATPTALSADALGLQPSGTPLRIDFGRAQDGVIDAVTRLLGRPPDNLVTQNECGAGPITSGVWEDSLILNFMQGDLRGWVTYGPDIPAEGLTAGMPVSSLPPVDFIDTTLGTEFEFNGIFGLIEPGSDRVSLLWSGTTCFFR